MKNFDIQLKRIQNEYGLTLIEVLASVVLLTLLLTTFITIYIQSANINKTSETIIDATYIAQTEMEKVYSKQKEYNMSNIDDAMIDLGYQPIGNLRYSYANINHSTYDVEILFEKVNDLPDNMNRILIKVSTNDTLHAQMENIFFVGGRVNEQFFKK